MNKENKTEIYATLLDYVENNLPQQKREEVEEFLAQNPEYKQDVDNYDGNITLAMPKRTDKENKITPEVIKLKVYNRQLRKQRNIMRAMATISSVAAVVLLIVMIDSPIPAIMPDNSQAIAKEIRTVDYINDTIYFRDTTIIRDTIKIEKDLFEEFDRKFNNNLQAANMINIEKDRQTDYPLRMKFANTDSSSIGGSQFIYKDNSNNGFVHTVAYNPYDKQIIGRQDFFCIKYPEPTLEKLEMVDKQIHDKIRERKAELSNHLTAAKGQNATNNEIAESLIKVRDNIQNQIQEQEGKNLASTKYLKENLLSIDEFINPEKYDLVFVRKEDLSPEVLLAIQEIEDIKEGDIHFKIYEDIENSLVYCIVDNIITNK